jgi:hypothetical protein
MTMVSGGRDVSTRMTRLAYLLLLILTAPTVSLAQFAQSTGPLPPVTSPVAAGELWSVTTVQEFYGLRDRELSKRDRQQTLVCYPRGTVSAKQRRERGIAR